MGQRVNSHFVVCLRFKNFRHFSLHSLLEIYPFIKSYLHVKFKESQVIFGSCFDKNKILLDKLGCSERHLGARTPWIKFRFPIFLN